MRLYIVIALIALPAACSPPSPQPQPNEMETVNGTLIDQPAPAGTPGNAAANYGQGSITPGEQGDIHAVEQPRPEVVIAKFADLLDKRQFDDAFKLVDAQALGASEKQFERRFSDYKTIDAEVGTIGRIEGAAGSLYSKIQLTLSGEKKDGSPYVMTGPVTLRRVNDVPGSTAEQRRWRIVKIELTADPKAAEKLVNQ